MEIKLALNERTLFVKFIGAIDENANYDSISFDNVKNAIFDFEDLKRLNSAGIQKWIKFLKAASSDIFVELKNCSIPIVNQLNNFPSFIPMDNIKILSFYAPYYCEETDKTYSVLLNVEKDFPNDDFEKPPVKLSPGTGKIAEFDEIPSKYFSFLKRL